ncbi:retrovirus-related pol polyprotein from transposon TNT 1-94 [Tanacetum coccineum]|uniref:Retrovirus-related pol polyprotein from transposon TNT 1-94 n=1 Tax=Tanacetum coccineum TaxID=301880 RepID=A0ABQ5FRP6_9ASTR
MIQVRLKETVRRIRTDNGTEFVNQTLREYYEKVGISHETSVARSPQQNGVVERQNRRLIEAARTMLIYVKTPLFLWAEAVATTCYTQNRSIIRRRHGKTPPDLSYLHVFGALCYPTNDSENLGKLQPKADIDMLFQSLFDEFLNPSPSIDHPAPEVVALINEVIAPVLVDSTGSPSSTTVDQDAPSPSNSKTIPEIEPPIIPNDVEEDNHDIEVAHMGNDPYFGVPIPKVSSDQSSSSDSIHTIVHPDHQISKHNSKWTKDHPLKNIISELKRPVSTGCNYMSKLFSVTTMLSSLLLNPRRIKTLKKQLKFAADLEIENMELLTALHRFHPQTMWASRTKYPNRGIGKAYPLKGHRANYKSVGMALSILEYFHTALVELSQPRAKFLRICPECEDFSVLSCLQEFSILSFIWESDILILLTTNKVLIGISHYVSNGEVDINKKDRKPSQNDKMKHGMEKTVAKS